MSTPEELLWRHCIWMKGCFYLWSRHATEKTAKLAMVYGWLLKTNYGCPSLKQGPLSD